MNPIISFEVNWYNSDTDKLETHYGFITAESMTDATYQLEEYYGDMIEGVTLNMYEGPFIVDESMYKEILCKLNEI